jgi:hypothetical protein
MDIRDIAATLAAIEHVTDALEAITDGQMADRFVALRIRFSALRSLVERVVRIEVEDAVARRERRMDKCAGSRSCSC